MQQTVVPGIAMWSVWRPERNFFFNSFFIETPRGNFGVERLLANGEVAWGANSQKPLVKKTQRVILEQAVRADFDAE